jgi:hypothetical protein
MVSAWRADTKDTLPADTTNVFCSSVFRAAEVAVTAGSAEATAWPGRHDGGWATARPGWRSGGCVCGG